MEAAEKEAGAVETGVPAKVGPAVVEAVMPEGAAVIPVGGAAIQAGRAAIPVGATSRSGHSLLGRQIPEGGAAPLAMVPAGGAP